MHEIHRSHCTVAVSRFMAIAGTASSHLPNSYFGGATGGPETGSVGLNAGSRTATWPCRE